MLFSKINLRTELIRERKSQQKLLDEVHDILKESIKKGQEIAVFGKPSLFGNMLQLSHPEIDTMKDEEDISRKLRIFPFYSSTEKASREGMDSKGIRSLVQTLLQEGLGYIHEIFPSKMLEEYHLIGRRAAFQQIHFPENEEMQRRAAYRLKFEEFFFFQLVLAKKRSTLRQKNKAPIFEKIGYYFNTFYHEHLPFQLTNAQKKVIKEIRVDLAQPIQMNRLVQGDVGSGKTMVAFMSMLIAKDNQYQSAMMAPTEILAEQHFRKISEFAKPFDIQVVKIVGGQKKSEREAVLEKLRTGEADIAVGTHALIEDTVQFHRLGLTIIDEQHKFGVIQRAKLWQKAYPFPHNMVMTATPIPRTLAMTLYGDLDVSVIDELPPGRMPIKTAIAGEGRRLEVLGFIRNEIEKGRQAYVVYPLIEESEKSDLLAAEQGKFNLEKYFSGYKIGLVHGRMKPDAKDVEMRLFIEKKTQVLVSTTVIEVGVDVPNASIMLIENAERFGLSQLHQLRGRVGRGAQQSWCILMTGQKRSSDARKRLQALADHQDGFKIAEIDLEIRGAGDFMGTRQSGIPEFRLADIVMDRDILQKAREAAFQIATLDHEWSLPQHEPLAVFFKKYLKKHAWLSGIA